jgi:hypothetical protein
MVVFECGQKRLRLAHFQDDPMEHVGGGRLAATLLASRRGNSALKSVASRYRERIPMMSGIWHIDSGADGHRDERLRFLLGIRGYDAAHAKADADLHALSYHRRNALHQVH